MTFLVQGAVTPDDSVSTVKVQNNAIDETKLKDALVADFTEVTVVAGDSILLGDASDSGNTKRDTVQGILDLAGGGITQNAIAGLTLSKSGADALTIADDDTCGVHERCLCFVGCRDREWIARYRVIRDQ